MKRDLFYEPKYRQRLDILEALAYDRFLCGKYLGALLGTTADVMKHSLDILMHEAYPYVKVCDYQTQNASDNMQVMRQFELTPLGIEIVQEHFGITPVPPTSPSHIKHQIMGDHSMASFRIGAKKSDGRFKIIPFQELPKHKPVTPNIIPLGGTIRTDKGKEVPHVMETDREAFEIVDTEKKLVYLIAGMECGRGTETHEPKDKSHDHTDIHSTTWGKFQDCIEILRKEIVEKTFYKNPDDAPGATFIFLEPDMPGRIKRMMELWADMTKSEPDLRPFVLFKTWHYYNKVYEANGCMLTDPFRIVTEDGTHSTFSFV